MIGKRWWYGGFDPVIDEIRRLLRGKGRKNYDAVVHPERAEPEVYTTFVPWPPATEEEARRAREEGSWHDH